MIVEEGSVGVIRSSFALGLPDDWSAGLELTPDSDFARHIVPFRRVVLLKQNLSDFRDFQNTAFRGRFSLVQNWLLIPLVAKERLRYLMIGFPRKYEDLNELSAKNEIIPNAG
ncbi:MAG: hypothetical protein EA427_08870 [Spirochaetaceae bacterium]|nr:MAG: hypothetical protein EA427_08870 [Spirochaetaceae bacterium]